MIYGLEALICRVEDAPDELEELICEPADKIYASEDKLNGVRHIIDGHGETIFRHDEALDTFSQNGCVLAADVCIQ